MQPLVRLFNHLQEGRENDEEEEKAPNVADDQAVAPNVVAPNVVAPNVVVVVNRISF